jgi:GH24 family phage-related lysozyme (muramidase)
VARYCPAAVSDQGQFDALVSFAFNCGLGALQRSTIRAAFNRGEVETAAEGFLKYTRAGGKVLPGLARRRNAERALFMSRVT